MSFNLLKYIFSSYFLIVYPLISMDIKEESLQTVLHKYNNQPTVDNIWNIANEITSPQYLKYFEEKECFTFEKTHRDLSKLKKLNPEEKRSELEKQVENICESILLYNKKIIELKEQEDLIEEYKERIKLCNINIEIFRSQIINIDIKKRFFSLLNEISENGIGKILLFRLSLELERKSSDTESSLGRDVLKKLSIVDEGEWLYRCSTYYPSIKISIEDTIYDYNHYNINNCTDYNTDKVSINLFHELLHWFHSLQNIEKFKKLYDYNNFSSSINLYFEIDGTNDKISSWFLREWCGINLDGNRSGSESDNESIDRDIEQFTLEELETVLGACKVDKEDFMGSELSENLYRLMGGFLIREHYITEGKHRTNQECNKIIEEKLKSNLLNVIRMLGLNDNKYIKK